MRLNELVTGKMNRQGGSKGLEKIMDVTEVSREAVIIDALAARP